MKKKRATKRKYRRKYRRKYSVRSSKKRRTLRKKSTRKTYRRKQKGGSGVVSQHAKMRWEDIVNLFKNHHSPFLKNRVAYLQANPQGPQMLLVTGFQGKDPDQTPSDFNLACVGEGLITVLDERGRSFDVLFPFLTPPKTEIFDYDVTNRGFRIADQTYMDIIKREE